MLPKEKSAAVAKIMKEFNVQFELLKKEYRSKIRKIIDKAEKEKLEKLRAELQK